MISWAKHLQICECFDDLFGATCFLSIKIVKEKLRNCKGFKSQTGHDQNFLQIDVSFRRNRSRIESNFDHCLGALTLPNDMKGDFRPRRKSIAPWDAIQQQPSPKIRRDGQAPLGLPALITAKQGRAEQSMAAHEVRCLISIIDGPDRVCYVRTFQPSIMEIIFYVFTFFL